MKNIVLYSLIGLSAAIPTIGTYAALHQPKTLHVALMTSMTGENSPWGKDLDRGAKLAIEIYKSKQPELTVSMQVFDTASRPDEAKHAAEQAVGTHPDVMVGEVSSGNSMQISQVGDAAAIPFVMGGATRPEITNGVTTFRTCFTDDEQGPAMAKFAYNQLKFRKMAIITDDSLSYSQRLSDDFRRTYKGLGGTIVGESKILSERDVDFPTAVKPLSRVKAEGVYFSGYFTEAGPLMRFARARGIDSVFLGGDGFDADVIVQNSMGKAVGSYFTSHYAVDDPRPQSLEFTKAWKAHYKGKAPATVGAAMGFESMMLALEAADRTPSITAQSMVKALSETTIFHGVSGDMNFADAHGSPKKRLVVVKIVPMQSDGSWQKFAGEAMP